MRYVLLECAIGEGCGYVRAFATLEQLRAYTESRPPRSRAEYWEVWDTLLDDRVKLEGNTDV